MQLQVVPPLDQEYPGLALVTTSVDHANSAGTSSGDGRAGAASREEGDEDSNSDSDGERSSAQKRDARALRRRFGGGGRAGAGAAPVECTCHACRWAAFRSAHHAVASMQSLAIDLQVLGLRDNPPAGAWQAAAAKAGPTSTSTLTSTSTSSSSSALASASGGCCGDAHSQSRSHDEHDAASAAGAGRACCSGAAEPQAAQADVRSHLRAVKRSTMAACCAWAALHTKAAAPVRCTQHPVGDDASSAPFVGEDEHDALLTLEAERLHSVAMFASGSGSGTGCTDAGSGSGSGNVCGSRLFREAFALYREGFHRSAWVKYAGAALLLLLTGGSASVASGSAAGAAAAAGEVHLPSSVPGLIAALRRAVADPKAGVAEASSGTAAACTALLSAAYCASRVPAQRSVSISFALGCAADGDSAEPVSPASQTILDAMLPLPQALAALALLALRSQHAPSEAGSEEQRALLLARLIRGCYWLTVAPADALGRPVLRAKQLEAAGSSRGLLPLVRWAAAVSHALATRAAVPPAAAPSAAEVRRTRAAALKALEQHCMRADEPLAVHADGGAAAGARTEQASEAFAGTGMQSVAAAVFAAVL